MILKCYRGKFLRKIYFSTSNTSDVEPTSDYYQANNNFKNCVFNTGLNSDLVSQISTAFVAKRMYYNLVHDVEGSVAYPMIPGFLGKILKKKIKCDMCPLEQDKHDEKVIFQL